MAKIKLADLQKERKKEAGQYGKRASMYDEPMQEIESIKSGEAVKLTEIDGKEITYGRANALKTRTEEYLDEGKYAFDFVKAKKQDSDGNELYIVFVYLKSDM